MRINSWLFNRRYARRLKKRVNSFDCKIKTETELIKSICIGNILTACKPLSHTMKMLAQKLRIKMLQHIRTVVSRNAFGVQTVLPNPLFSQIQIAGIIFKYIINQVAIGALLFFESFLYLLIAALFLPGAPMFMKVGLSLFLVLLLMLSLHYAFEKHFQYRDAVDMHRKGDITDTILRKYRDKRNFGYCLLVLTLAAIIIGGWARISFMEYIPPDGLSEEKLKQVQQASKWGSLFTLLVTITAPLFLALIKQEQTKLGIQFRLIKYWFRTHRLRNRYTQQLIHAANEMLLLVDERIEKHWQLAVSLKKLFCSEFDERFEPLHREYVRLKTQRGFVVTGDIYSRFHPIQSSCEELFKYGIRNSFEIVEKVAFAHQMLAEAEALIAEQMPAWKPPGLDAAPERTAPDKNGTAKKSDFITI